MKAKLILPIIIIAIFTSIVILYLPSETLQEGIFGLGGGNSLLFNVVVNTSFPEVPENLMVYKIIPVNQEEANMFAYDLARKLFKNLIHNATDGEVYCFADETSELEVNVPLGWFRYMKRGDWGLLRPQPLSEEEAIAKAKSIIEELNLTLPDTVISVNRGGSATAVAFRMRIGNYTADTLGVYISLGERGEVLCIEGLIYRFKPDKEFKIIKPKEAYEILLKYIRYGHPPKGPLVCFVNYKDIDNLIINKINIRYKVGGGYPQRTYVFPIYVFEGLCHCLYTPPGKYESFIGIIDAVDRLAS
ncbi:MAG: hypothetical protein QXY40_00890 [Candidatus Methanomethylicia archaeon]